MQVVSRQLKVAAASSFVVGTQGQATEVQDEYPLQGGGVGGSGGPTGGLTDTETTQVASRPMSPLA